MRHNQMKKKTVLAQCMCFGGMNAFKKIAYRYMYVINERKKAIYIIFAMILKECQSSQHSFVSFEIEIESK